MEEFTVSKLLRNWLIVYAGNFLGSLLIVYWMAKSNESVTAFKRA